MCVGMAKLTFLPKLKGLGLHGVILCNNSKQNKLSRIYGFLSNMRGIENKMHGKEYFLLNLDLMEVCYY